jgi:V/A-type H+-transporting ATPase subunit D
VPNRTEYSPTPSVLMELREERNVVREGYRFLDEKRLLLAAEILRRLQHYREMRARFDSEYEQAAHALRRAVARHGLHGLQVYPAGSLAGASLSTRRRRFLGVPLQSVQMEFAQQPPREAVDPSPEARQCAETFGKVLSLSAEMAVVTANLERLLEEYHRTSRRARALEDVILPELDEAVSEVAGRLEELDQEESVRTHFRNPGVGR